MVTEADWQNWTPAELAPYIDVVFDAFGSDRIMYGSDWPVCLLAAEYSQQFEIVTNYGSRNWSLRQSLKGAEVCRRSGGLKMNIRRIFIIKRVDSALTSSLDLCYLG